jgi:hypothetical protein
MKSLLFICAGQLAVLIVYMVPFGGNKTAQPGHS